MLDLDLNPTPERIVVSYSGKLGNNWFGKAES